MTARVEVQSTQRSSHHTVTINRVTSSNAPTVIRVRLFRGRQLVRNQAARVRSHRARFTLRLGKNAKRGPASAGPFFFRAAGDEATT